MASEQLKTWVLKVSIHCEGCKKKVIKKLKGIDGVREAVVDSQQGKVTVIAAVDAETLIKKLIKSGKHAELWPVERPTNTNNPPTPKSNSDANNGKQVNSSSKPHVKSEPTPPVSAAAGGGGKGKVIESDDEEKSDAEATNSRKPVPAAPKDSESSATGNGNGGGGGGGGGGGNKKSSSKGNKESDERREEEEVNVGYRPVQHQPVYQPLDYPPQPVYQPRDYPPQPVHSYNMAHPSTSYAYYAQPPMAAAPPYSYAEQQSTYSGRAQPESHSGEANYYSPYSAYPPPESYYSSGRHPADTYYSTTLTSSSYPGNYDMFSDENPNGCKVM